MKATRILRRLLGDKRGSADLNTYLLLTAAGCTMVGLTAPHLYKSSKTASDTFDQQVRILERGSSSSGGMGSSGGASSGGWDLGNMNGLGQLAGAMGGGGGQLTAGGGQLAQNGGQLASAGGQLAQGGGQLASAGGATVVSGSGASNKSNDPKNNPGAQNP